MSDSVREAERYWNSSAIIEEFQNAEAPSYWKNFFDAVNNKENIKVLDLGCGGGRNTVMLAELGFMIYACDLHIGMVETTKKRIKELVLGRNLDEAVRQENMTNLTYLNNNFDVVLANGIFHNTSTVQEFEMAVSEASRVLKDTGFLCMNVFTDKIIDEGLKEQDREYLYLTPDNLDMILLPEEKVLDMLKMYHLEPVGEIVSYPSKINVGVRSVLRGVFQKK